VAGSSRDGLFVELSEPKVSQVQLQTNFLLANLTATFHPWVLHVSLLISRALEIVRRLDAIE